MVLHTVGQMTAQDVSKHSVLLQGLQRLVGAGVDAGVGAGPTAGDASAGEAGWWTIETKDGKLSRFVTPAPTLGVYERG